MEKGVSKNWSLRKEAAANHLISHCRSFAERVLITSIRDMMKYDLRTRAGRRAKAQLHLQLAVATDQELEELATLKVALLGDSTVEEALEELKAGRERFREEGIKKSEICR